MREDVARVLHEEFSERVDDDPDYLTVFDTYVDLDYPLTPDLNGARGHAILGHVDYLVNFVNFIVEGDDFSLNGPFYKHSLSSLDDFLIKNPSLYNDRMVMGIIYSGADSVFEPDIGCELARLGYSPDSIVNLLPVVSGWVNKIISLYDSSFSFGNVLSAAIRLSCRGEFQCPVSLKPYIKKSKSVFKQFPKLIDELRYDGAGFISNVFSRAVEVFGLSDEFLDKCDEYLMIVKCFPKALAHWRPTASAIVYLAGRDKGLTQKMIVNKLGLTGESTLRKYYQGIEKLYKQNSST